MITVAGAKHIISIHKMIMRWSQSAVWAEFSAMKFLIAMCACRILVCECLLQNTFAGWRKSTSLGAQIWPFPIVWGLCGWGGGWEALQPVHIKSPSLKGFVRSMGRVSVHWQEQRCDLVILVSYVKGCRGKNYLFWPCWQMLAPWVVALFGTALVRTLENSPASCSRKLGQKAETFRVKLS